MAEPAHGIAMHGDLKYPPGFAHFDYVNPDAPKGGTLHQAVTGTFDTLHPHVVKGIPAAGAGMVFETLLARSWDEPFSLYGLVAATVEMPEDRSRVEFTLRPEARWHDGTPITADDVLFSLDMMRRHGTPNRRLFYAKVEGAEAPDPHRVRFIFRPGPDGTIDREMPLLMGLMPLHARHWWEGRAFEKTTLDPPMGSGPYRVAAVDPGRKVVYERVADYWGRDLPVRRGLHNADRMEFDYYRDDSVALEAFLAGKADVRVERDPARWAKAYTGPPVRDGRIILESLPHARPEPVRAFVFNQRRAPFGDIRVREALATVFDFDWINRTLFHDAYRRTASFYPNSELAATGLPDAAERAVLEPFRATLPPELFTDAYAPPGGAGPHDRRAALRRATDLLTGAGWRHENGRLVDGAGRPLAFEILLGGPADERVALEWARALGRLGVTARVRVVDSAQYQGRMDAYDFDVTVGRWASTLSPGNEQLYYFGSAAADQPGSRNLPGIRDAAVDSIAASIAEARSRIDLVARVRALDRVLLWGQHALPLYHQTADHVARWSRLKRPSVTPVYGYVIEAWWLEDR